VLNSIEKWAAVAFIVVSLVLLTVFTYTEAPEPKEPPKYNVERDGKYLAYIVDHQDLKMTTTWTRFPRYSLMMAFRRDGLRPRLAGWFSLVNWIRFCSLATV